MTAKECLQILRDIKDVAFATVDEKGMPHARMIDVMLVEEEKLYFCTARGKNFYRQLENLPRTEITGMNREYQMVRLSGKVKRLADQKKWIDRIFRENPSMNDVYPHDSRYILSGLGHALFHNSVIRAHDHQCPFRKIDLTGSLNSGDPHQGIL